MIKPNIPSDSFCATLEANIDNKDMDDVSFRQFVRNTIPAVIFDSPTRKVEEDTNAKKGIDDASKEEENHH